MSFNPVELKRYRTRLDLTLIQMAHFVGVPMRTWSNWESDGKNHRNMPTAATSLIELLQMIEVMAPNVHQVRLASARKVNE